MSTRDEKLEPLGQASDSEALELLRQELSPDEATVHRMIQTASSPDRSGASPNSDFSPAPPFRPAINWLAAAAVVAIALLTVVFGARTPETPPRTADRLLAPLSPAAEAALEISNRGGYVTVTSSQTTWILVPGGQL